MLQEKQRNKIRAVFKLQLHATQVNQLGWGVMMVSLVPLDIGKTTMRTDRVPVIDGSCSWRHPIYETVKLLQDSGTGEIHDKLYNFVVSANGSEKTAIVGEARINLSDYFDAAKPACASLPLKPVKSGVILSCRTKSVPLQEIGFESVSNSYNQENLPPSPLYNACKNFPRSQ